MVPVVSLLLPILLSAVIVFLASSVIHVLLTYHQSDFREVPSEDAVMDALRPFDIPPGDYVIPRAGSTSEMKSPEFVAKATRGPVAFVTVLPNGPPSLTGSLVLWFLYSILVGVAAAYVAGRALGPGAEYLAVFRFTGVAALLGYAMALLQNSIWYKRNWTATLKSVFDGFIYALLTAGTFGWLWPWNPAAEAGRDVLTLVGVAVSVAAQEVFMKRVCAFIAVAFLLMVPLAGGSESLEEVTVGEGPGIVHAVFFWLKEGTSEEQKQQLVDDCNTLLRAISSVRGVAAGPPAGTEGGPIDNSYDVGLVVRFDDQAGLDHYADAPRHLEFIRKHRDLWEKVQVYDVQVH